MLAIPTIKLVSVAAKHINPSLGSVVLTYCVGITMLYFLTAFLKAKWQHFANAWVYPPAFVTVLVASCLICLLAAARVTAPLISLKSSLALLGTAVGYLIAVALVTRRIETRQSAVKATPSERPERATFESWLCCEMPISTSVDDRLNNSHRVERIVRALKTERITGTGQMQTVVIRGAFGAGKSSLISLVRERAATDRMLFVEVSCWGFESSARVREYVIERCVDALSEKVDCLNLRGLPKHYVNALGSVVTWGGSIEALFNYSRTPRETLAEFQPILEALNYQIVVVVEDMDRNGKDFDSAHIESMLHDFRSAPRLSFILSISAGDRIEFPKIAEAIEFLPNISPEVALGLLDETRHELLTAEPYLDPPATMSGNERFRPPTLRPNTQEGGRIAAFFHGDIRWAVAVARLTATPRLLKALLNALRREWPNLRGEVDIDVWMMVLALRHCAPGAFTFLGSYLRELRDVSPNGWNASDKDKSELGRRVQILQTLWQRVVDNGDFDRESVEILFVELIPATALLFAARHIHAPNRLQGINKSGEPDYWSRIVAGAVDRDDVRDQDVFAAMIAAKNGAVGIAALAKRCVEKSVFSDRFVIFEEYCRMLWDQQRVDLLAAAHDEVLARDGVRASSDSAGFNKLQSRFERENIDDNILEPWLVREAARTSQRSLKLANDVLHPYLKNRRFAPAVRREFVELFRTWLEASPPGTLAGILDPSFPYSLYHLVYLWGQEDQAAVLTRAKDWEWLGSILLRDMPKNLTVLLPQVIQLIGNAVPVLPNYPTDYLYDDKKLHGVFGEASAQMIALIASAQPSFPDLDRLEAHKVQLAILRAKKPNDSEQKAAPATMLVERLRTELSDYQKELLTKIGEAFLKDEKGFLATKLHLEESPDGKKKVSHALRQLNGCIVFEREGHHPNGPGYCVTLLGLLLSARGSEFETLLVKFVELVAKMVSANHELRSLNSATIDVELGLSEPQSRLLRRLISEGHFWHANMLGPDHGPNVWEAHFADRIDELPSWRSKREFLHDCVMKHYDPKKPVFSAEARAYGGPIPLVTQNFPNREIN